MFRRCSCPDACRSNGAAGCKLRAWLRLFLESGAKAKEDVEHDAPVLRRRASTCAPRLQEAVASIITDLAEAGGSWDESHVRNCEERLSVGEFTFFGPSSCPRKMLRCSLSAFPPLFNKQPSSNTFETL